MPSGLPTTASSTSDHIDDGLTTWLARVSLTRRSHEAGRPEVLHGHNVLVHGGHYLEQEAEPGDMEEGEPVDHGRHGSVLGVQSVLAGPLEGASVAHSYAFGRRRAPRVQRTTARSEGDTSVAPAVLAWSPVAPGPRTL